MIYYVDLLDYIDDFDRFTCVAELNVFGSTFFIAN